MENKPRKLTDYALQFVKDLLKDKFQTPEAAAAAPKKVSLEDLPYDDLKREKIRLEQEERKMLARLKEVEKAKRQLFEEGVRNASDREQRVIARRIKELDVDANNMDRMLQVISKQMRIANGLMQLKERSRMASESALGTMLKDMDLQDLIVYIDRASVDGEFSVDKFDDLIHALEEADAIHPEHREDQDVLDIVRAMNQAREAGDSPEALDEQYRQFDQQREKKASEGDLESLEEEL